MTLLDRINRLQPKHKEALAVLLALWAEKYLDAVEKGNG